MPSTTSRVDSIDLASSTVMTPSLPTFSMTTLRPRGPRVTLTASAKVFTPRRIWARAFSSNKISLAAICVLLPLLLDDAEDLFLAQNEVLDAIDGDLVPGVLSEEDPIAG